MNFELVTLAIMKIFRPQIEIGRVGLVVCAITIISVGTMDANIIWLCCHVTVALYPRYFVGSVMGTNDEACSL